MDEIWKRGIRNFYFLVEKYNNNTIYLSISEIYQRFEKLKFKEKSSASMRTWLKLLILLEYHFDYL